MIIAQRIRPQLGPQHTALKIAKVRGSCQDIGLPKFIAPERFSKAKYGDILPLHTRFIVLFLSNKAA